MNKKIGIIGLGAMGKVFAENLISSGFTVYVYNRNLSNGLELLEKGALWCKNPKQMIMQCDVIINCVYDDAAVSNIICGEDGIIFASDLNSKIILETSTISLATAVKMQKQIEAKNGFYVDCPISGNPAAVRERRATFYLGADNSFTEKVNSYLKGITANLIVCQEFLAALKVKLCLNNLLFTQWLSFCESLNLAESLGVQRQDFINAMGGSVAASPFLTQRAKMFDEMKEPASINFLEKDALIISQTAKVHGASVPQLESFMDVLECAREFDFINQDMVGVYLGYLQKYGDKPTF